MNTSRIAFQADETLAPADLVASIRARRGGKLLNLDRMLLKSPPFAAAWNRFLGPVRKDLGLDARLRELAICAVAVLNRADYELAQHGPELLACGGTQEQVDALQDYERAMLNSANFNDAERAILRLAREMTCQVQVSAACFADLQRTVPDEQHQVEMVGVIAAYNMVSRFLEALQVPAE